MSAVRALAGRSISLALRSSARIRAEAGRRKRLLEEERRRRARLAALQTQDDLLLDVGAGSAHLDGWVSLDLEPDPAGIRMDATKTWPFRDGSARAVRAEHIIEHLTFDEARACIVEIHRVLAPGGLCRICTPDLEGIARAYLEQDPSILATHREHGYVAPTWSHLPNNYIRMWGHQYMFDFAALRTLLEEAGFAEVERTPFNRSRHALLDGTDSHDPGPLEPLVVCVDAVKPG